MMDDDIIDHLVNLADRWEHGHDELTDGCALCNAEYAEALTIVHGGRKEP